MSPSYAAPSNAVATNNSIAGGLIAGFVGIVVSLLLLCFCCFRRSKAEKARVAGQNATFTRAEGPSQLWTQERNLSSTSHVPPPLFSRPPGRPSVAIPEKTIPRTPHSHSLSDKGAAFSGRDTSPTSSKSSLQHPALNPSPRERTLSSLNPARSRHDRSSSGFSMYSSNPSPSRSNYRISSLSSMSPFQPRPARQLFEPSLPDELPISRSGEYLTVLQSFDDGWCLVARDAPSSSRRASFFSVRKGENVDMGVVPAWVFAEPLKGVTVTRPFRSSSVNALHPGGNPGDVRNTGLSWSLFA